MASWLSRSTRRWLSDHWSTFVILLSIFFLAIFLRTFFSFDLATTDGFVLSGGSDSYYHKRIIDAVVQTGKHVFEEPLLNYPSGIQASGRPPLYDWSVAVTGMVVAPLFASVDVAVWYTFLSSTAFWGALTIFPLYFLTKEAFGRRAGLIAAFFLAVMPAHIQRSPFTNGDHDAYLLFFVVAAFFFFLKALRSLEETRWVADWRKPREIGAGLRRFYAGNQTALLYALMSAMSITAIALAWKGFAYVIVILLIYLLLELLINRFRNVDSMGVMAVFAVTVGVALLLSFPWYLSYGFIQTWFDVPAILYAAALVLGAVFVVTRDYPWTLILPLVFVFVGGGFLVASAFIPGLADAFLSGAGYFVRTKAYETIAEAQAPNFSQVALSLGAITYYLSLGGLAWAAVQVPRRPQADYLFVVVWSGASIFMALAAARFLFNGAPAFAVTAAWVVSIILDRLDFSRVKRTFQGLRGNKLTALRKSLKIRHVVGALFIAFLVVGPNVWYGVDASIPVQTKKDYDEQVYNAIPEPLRPEAYTPDSNFFFGAFGYSLPLKRQYFPSAWTWLSQQDTGTFPWEDRPAFLSWWDYGFEAVNEGQHPTVADNFLDGYQLAGNFIMAQTEAEAIAYLSARLLEGDMATTGSARELTPATTAALEAHGVDVILVKDILRFPALFIDDIVSNPARYGPRDARMDTLNAKFIALKTHLVETLPDADQQADLYRDIRLATGWSIRYFAIDTRLFPFSGLNTGIFYAPAKLSDHRIEETRTGASIPCDFYDISLITDQGTFRQCIVEPPPGARQTDNPRIDYQSMFFQTMLYRAFVGFGPGDLERPIADGIPGISGNLQQEPPLLGWNLSHFRVAYRTAYYNPFPADQVANHTNAWRAINLLEAVELQRQINLGLAEGVIDASFTSYARSGLVILKYYDGAEVFGTVTVDGVTPFPGARVTVLDELGVPHDTVLTDANGRYEILAPFGSVDVVVTEGTLDLKTKLGATELARTSVTITDDQAMRRPFDLDGDGRLDYRILRDFVIDGGSVTGVLFLDTDGDGEPDAGETTLTGDVTFEHLTVASALALTTAPDGTYALENLIPGDYSVNVTTRERILGPFGAQVASGEPTVVDLGLPVANLTVNLTLPDGLPAAGVPVVVEELVDGTEHTRTTSEAGTAVFTDLLAGAHSLRADLPGLTTGRIGLTVVILGDNTVVAALQPAGTLEGRTRIGGASAGHVTLKLVRDSSDPSKTVLTTDATGRYSAILPAGTYNLHASHTLGGTTYAVLRQVVVRADQTSTVDLNLQEAAWVHGRTLIEDDIERGADVTFRKGEAWVTTVSSGIAEYRLFLPPGEYGVSAVGDDVAAYTRATLQGENELDLILEPTSDAVGRVYRDLNGNGAPDSGEGVQDASVVFTAPDGGAATQRTGGGGQFIVPLVNGTAYTLRVERAGFAAFVGETRAAENWVVAGNHSLTALDVPVSGTLTFTDAPADVVLQFTAAGGGARDASAIAVGGTYQVALAPGSYAVTIRHNLTEAGDTRYENRGGETFEVLVGESGVTFDVDVVRRHRVAGAVTVGGTAGDPVITFSGIDAATAEPTDGAYEVFLAEGAYDVRSTEVVVEAPFVFLGTLQVTGPVQYDVALEPAVRVSGTLERPTGRLEEVATIRVTRAAGGVAEAETTDTGNYEVFLLPGVYTFEVDHPTTRPVPGGLKYVRYVASETVTVPPDVAVYPNTIQLEEVPDTVHVTGQVTFLGVGVGAELNFTALTPSGDDLVTAAAGDGTLDLDLSPGDYNLYATRAVGPSVFLGQVSFAPREDATLQVPLEDALLVSGTLLYGGGTPTAGTVTFEGAGTLTTTAGGDGKYQAYLPAGLYTVTAEATVGANGRTDTYSTTQTLDLAGDTVLTLALDLEVHHGVDLVWIEGAPFTARGGESVTYRVAVTNDGNVPDTYEMRGVPPRAGWLFTFSEDRVTLEEGAPSRVVEVTITLPADALVDHGPISVRAGSVTNQSVFAIVPLEVNVVRVTGIDITLAEAAPRFDGTYIHQGVRVRNAGNAPETFTVQILNEAGLATLGWEASLVAPNGTVVGVVATGLPIGANDTEDLTVRFRNLGPAGTVQATLLGFLEGDRGVDQVFSVTATSPTLTVASDTLTVQGTGITLALEEDLVTLAAFPIAVAVIAVLSLLYIWRKRRRWGR